jgi:Sugar-transfer associated ATP-grasp
MKYNKLQPPFPQRVREYTRDHVALRLPYWDEVKNLAARAARAVAPLRYVGWEIALTNDGPVVIEGNDPSDVSMLQDGVGGLRDTPLGVEIRRGAGVGQR